MVIRVLAVIALMFSGLSTAATKVTIYGDNGYPPYSYNEFGNELSGIYTQILEQIFSRMPDYEVSLEGISWKDGLKLVEKGKIFALYPPYKRAQRPFMEYDAPILQEEQTVFCRKSVLETKRDTWPDDYLGLKVGNNAGYAVGGDKFWELVKSGDITVEEAESTSANLLKLIDGKLDCYMNDGLSIEWELKKLAKKGEYDGSSIQKSDVISSENGYLGFATNGDAFPYKDDFKAKYLKILKELKESGKIDRIIRQYVR
ncbi:ABC transporter substrate-binding protein [Motiliproteus sp. MSK22-1]|nr:ABC transporter substrate-binding protein [Motiliproteus sp. MSK22-1]